MLGLPAPRAVRNPLNLLNLLRVLHLLHLLFFFAYPRSDVRCEQVPVMVGDKVCVSPTAPPIARTSRAEPPKPTPHAVRHILNLLNLLCILHLVLFFVYSPSNVRCGQVPVMVEDKVCVSAITAPPIAHTSRS